MITPELMSQLGLTNTAGDEAVVMAITTAAVNAAKLPALQSSLDLLRTENTTLKGDKEKAEKELSDIKGESAKTVIKSLIDAAQTAGKLTVKMGTQLAADYATNPEGLKTLLEGMTGRTSVTDAIDQAAADLSTLVNKTWDELDKSGDLPKLKADNPDLFKAKFKAKFGKEYNG